MTPRDIIQMALRDAGALGEGIIASSEEVNDAFIQLNWLLSQWQRKRWLIWGLQDFFVVSTGATSYTVGPGGDIPMVARPDRLESAFVRQLTGNSQPSLVDYPLEIIPSMENYSVIALKQLQSFPQYIFYDSAFPLGSIFPWPVPQAGLYSTHIQIKTLLSQFAGIDQDIILPGEYMPAMEFNLAIRIIISHGLPQRPDLVALAKESLNVLRQANEQIANLRMPGELVRNGIYNPYSDQIR